MLLGVLLKVGCISYQDWGTILWLVCVKICVLPLQLYSYYHDYKEFIYCFPLFFRKHTWTALCFPEKSMYQSWTQKRMTNSVCKCTCGEKFIVYKGIIRWVLEVSLYWMLRALVAATLWKFLDIDWRLKSYSHFISDGNQKLLVSHFFVFFCALIIYSEYHC